MKLTATFVPQSISVAIVAPTMGVDTGIPIARDYVDRDPYEGEYVVTPGADAVVLPTKNLWMRDNITINPIPSNYGKITWNGAVMTVS